MKFDFKVGDKVLVTAKHSAVSKEFNGHICTIAKIEGNYCVLEEESYRPRNALGGGVWLYELLPTNTNLSGDNFIGTFKEIYNKIKGLYVR